MKIYLLLICLTSIALTKTFAQVKKNNDSHHTMIDKYFNTFEKLSGYEVREMNELMIRRSNEDGMWKHPAISKLMKQITFYQYLDLPASPESIEKILGQVSQKIKQEGVYEEYFKWEKNGYTSVVIYTKGKKPITELVTIVMSPGNLHVSSFSAASIDITSIKALTVNP